jgi:hypothetical protein
VGSTGLVLVGKWCSCCGQHEFGAGGQVVQLLWVAWVWCWWASGAAAVGSTDQGQQNGKKINTLNKRNVSVPSVVFLKF